MENNWDGKKARRRKKTKKLKGEKLRKFDGCFT